MPKRTLRERITGFLVSPPGIIGLILATVGLYLAVSGKGDVSRKGSYVIAEPEFVYYAPSLGRLRPSRLPRLIKSKPHYLTGDTAGLELRLVNHTSATIEVTDVVNATELHHPGIYEGIATAKPSHTGHLIQQPVPTKRVFEPGRQVVLYFSATSLARAAAYELAVEFATGTAITVDIRPFVAPLLCALTVSRRRRCLVVAATSRIGPEPQLRRLSDGGALGLVPVDCQRKDAIDYACRDAEGSPGAAIFYPNRRHPTVKWTTDIESLGGDGGDELSVERIPGPP